MRLLDLFTRSPPFTILSHRLNFPPNLKPLCKYNTEISITRFSNHTFNIPPDSAREAWKKSTTYLASLEGWDCLDEICIKGPKAIPLQRRIEGTYSTIDTVGAISLIYQKFNLPNSNPLSHFSISTKDITTPKGATMTKAGDELAFGVLLEFAPAWIGTANYRYPPREELEALGLATYN